MYDAMTDLFLSTIEEMIVRSAQRYVEARRLIKDIPPLHPTRGHQRDRCAEASDRPVGEIPHEPYNRTGATPTSRRYKPLAGDSIASMCPNSKETEALNSVDDKNKGAQTLADDITKRIATRLVANCNPSSNRASTRSRSTATSTGKVKPKFRQPFNVVLPTFAGMMDTLAADFNEFEHLEAVAAFGLRVRLVVMKPRIATIPTRLPSSNGPEICQLAALQETLT